MGVLRIVVPFVVSPLTFPWAPLKNVLIIIIRFNGIDTQQICYALLLLLVVGSGGRTMAFTWVTKSNVLANDGNLSFVCW